MDTTKPTERVAFSINEICKRNRISRGKYFSLRRAGLGPAEMRLPPNTIRITLEAERDWQRACEQPTGDQLAAVEQSRAELAARGSRAGKAAAESVRHVSKQKRVRRSAP
jgi:hypothetical protein